MASFKEWFWQKESKEQKVARAATKRVDSSVKKIDSIDQKIDRLRAKIKPI